MNNKPIGYQTTTITPSTPGKDSIAELIARLRADSSMSLNDKIGELFFIGVEFIVFIAQNILAFGREGRARV